MVVIPSTNRKKSAGSLRRLRSTICGLLLALLLSCSQYEFTLNDNTLYDPQAFRRNLQMSDAALLQCTRNIIVEKNITAATQLKQLLCGPGDIATLDGIEAFTKLEQLGLAGNRIQNIVKLGNLSKLQQLNLSHNDIRDASILDELNALSFVDLSGNTQLICSSVTNLAMRKTLQLFLPEHC